MVPEGRSVRDSKALYYFSLILSPGPTRKSICSCGRPAILEDGIPDRPPEPVMPLFSPLDLFALAFFSVTWIVYAVLLEWTPKGASGLNARMHGYRDEWMQQMLQRDMRMLDGQIMGSLQNGTAFFASTSLIAIGGTLTVLRSTEDLITIVSTLPFGIPTTRMEWEIKTIGLATIFVYAFFKFAWSYRLYN